jgi:large subunit ribosomal protein L40e
MQPIDIDKIVIPPHRAILFYLEYCHYHGRGRYKTSLTGTFRFVLYRFQMYRLSKEARAYLWSDNKLELRRLSTRMDRGKASNKACIPSKDVRVYSESTNHHAGQDSPIDNSPVSTTMQIFVKNLNGNTFCLNVKLSDSIADVKAMISEKHGIPVDDQVLVYGGRLLANDRTPFDYNIRKESTIHLSLRVRGGSHHDEV